MRPPGRSRWIAFGPLGLVALAAAGCAPPPPATRLPPLDPAYFERMVEPELLASCAYSACHGAPLRPLRVFSLAGLRANPALSSTQPLTADEHRANYVRALAAAAATSAGLPDLLRKPLQVEAGGSGHGGVDRYGRNVYADRQDPRWLLLSAWVDGAVWEGGGQDGGAEVDGGAPSDGGAPVCAPRGGLTYDRVAAIVTKATCAKEAGCHTPENASDAGCFVADTCETLRQAGCAQRAVLPCDLFRSRLLQFTGARPYGVKSHQGVLLPIHADAIAEWIDGGAPCDGGGL